MGHEQHNHEGDRPRAYLIVSDGRLQGRAPLVIACPLSTSARDDEKFRLFRIPVTPDMIEVTPEDRGVLKPSLLLCEQLRVMSTTRFEHPSRLGRLKPGAMAEVELRLLAALGIRPPA